MDNQSLRTIELVDDIIKKYSDMVFRIAFTRTKSKFNADDVMQEVFMRYIKKDRIFENEEHRKAWFIRATTNCSNSLLSSFWHKNTTSINDIVISENFEFEDNSKVYDAVMSLSKSMRTLIHLFYYEGYSIKEIANILDKSESAIKTQLFRARKQLKTKLEEEDL